MGSSTLDRGAIEALIPHRDPFLFVDRVVGRTENSIVTEWDVSPALPAFRGHYPGEPVLPGVLISEFAFQSAAILLASEAVAGRALPVLTRIEDARFRRIVRPDETLRAAVRLLDRVDFARYMEAAVTCGAQPVARLRFTVALTALAP